MQSQNFQASEIFRQVVEAAPNGMLMANRAGQIVLVNAQTAKLFGYSLDEMLKLDIEALVPERFRGRHPSLRNGYFNNPQVRAMGAGRDLFGLRKDGSEFPVEIGLNPINNSGEPYVLASVIDITQRKRGEEMFRRVVEAAPNGMVMINSMGKVVLANRQAERMFCYESNELLQLSIEMLVPVRFRADHPKHRGAYFSNPQVRAMGAGRDLFGLRKDQSEFPVEIGLNPISTEDGLFVLASVIDITERKRDEERMKASLHEKEVLLKEIHHRVKNNLAVVSSLFYLQSTYVTDPGMAAVLQESQDRVRSMSLVHETLYRSQNLAGIDLGEYAHSLVENLLSTYRPPEGKLCVLWETEPVLLTIEQAIPCGLILNELIVNCMKHAFPRGMRGRITIGLKKIENTCEVKVCDSGAGIPLELDVSSARTLGLRLIRSLSGQLDGKLGFSRTEPGTEVLLTFPIIKGGA